MNCFSLASSYRKGWSQPSAVSASERSPLMDRQALTGSPPHLLGWTECAHEFHASAQQDSAMAIWEFPKTGAPK